ncbi:MAG: DUF707 domain-containing protein [Betaproteobacteria bacterium]|nr:DUF707 domain-containing protein [Betaproteobacteria bacterium]
MLINLLTRSAWRFSHGDTSQIAPVLLLLPKGVIGGHLNSNEQSWELRENSLVFLNSNDVATTVFSEIEFDAGDPVRMTGKCIQEGNAVRVLDRINLPSGIDLGQQSRQEAPDFLRMVDRTKSLKNRNLVVLRANDQSLHTQWPQNIPIIERSWDLCISWYGNVMPAKIPECEYFTFQPEDRKFGAIHALFLGDSPLWNYDQIWLPDDDIMTSWADINRLFAICRRHELDLAQPALLMNGNISHQVTVHNPVFSLRYTNFVEVMCPLFSREGLQICHPVFNGSISGWGLDYIWPHLLGGVSSKVAIIDDVIVVHTRPVGGNYDRGNAIIEDIKLRELYAIPTNTDDCGGLIKNLSLC